MKYLNNYTEEATTKLLNKTGAFFAFSNEQLDEQKKEGVKYVSMGVGMICPKDNAKELLDGLENIHKEGIKADIAENGKQAIIHRELGNHEYCITYDITDTLASLWGYGITAEEVQEESGEYLRKHHEWEEAQEALATA